MKPQAKPQASPVLIRLEDVRKRYDMGDVVVHAMAGVSLEIDRGDFVAIMGSSGSGKSTMMNILGCLAQPTSGRYFLAGREVSRLNANALAMLRNETIGFVFQSFNLLPRTSALENVELPLLYGGVGGRERRRRAKAALEKVGLGDRIHHGPNEMSGGQQQRVAIARALVSRPSLLLADEPTGNLDSRTTQEVLALLAELSSTGITIVMVTHEDEVAACARRIIVMRDGQIESDRRQPAAEVAP